uniref:Uncharacterized protein n=1 Tax=Anguilla anguilla TaxID=7936 RepID=A0A0E9W363_ANGAN
MLLQKKKWHTNCIDLLQIAAYVTVSKEVHKDFTFK